MAVPSRVEPGPPAAEPERKVVPLVRERLSLADVVRREARRRRRRIFVRLVVFLLVAAGVVAGVYLYKKSREVPIAERWVTRPLTRGDVRATVRATGRVEARVRVEVGSSVSGRVSKVRAGFNARVRKGQILAMLDTESTRAQLAQAKARVLAGRASVTQVVVELKDAERRLRIARSLFRKGVETQTGLDAAEAAVDRARAMVENAKAQDIAQEAAWRVARTAVRDAIIRAPIDGIVIARNVEPGQTVAAMLTTPVLFVLAADLREMRVLASIDEADIARVRKGQRAAFTVDAFPGREFPARVTEVRSAPILNQNVVTYEAVLDVDNPTLELRPGMTATVRVVTAEAKGVLRAPAAALRFSPPGTEPTEEKRLHVVDALGEPRPRAVRVGLSDGAFTEVSGEGLREGLPVVLEATAAWRRALGSEAKP